MAITSVAKNQSKIFYGWWVVVAAATMSWCGAGLHFYGFSVVFKAIISHFGWTRAVTAGAFSLARLEGGLEGPIVGWLIDKFGPRRMALFGAAVVGLGYILLSRMNSIVMLYVLFGLVISVGYGAGFTHAATAAVANWFVKKRSRALGFYTLGAGVGGATMVPLLGWLISQYGWRITLFVMGLATWVIVVPLSFVFRHKPEQYGYLPDGDSVAEEEPSKETEIAVSSDEMEVEDSPGEMDFTWREALRTASFWLVVLAGVPRLFGGSSVVLHAIAHLTDVGISDVAAAVALGSMLAMSIPGRLLFGWLGDRYPIRYVLIAAYALQAVGILMLSRVETIEQVYISLVVFALGYGGAIPLFWAIRGEYFGRKNFATISGLMQLFLMIPTMIGPILAGYTYDVTGSYYQAFILFVILYLFGIVILYFAKPPARKKNSRY